MPIILTQERPAVPIAGGTFAAPTSRWASLADQRERIDAAIACVGRVEVEGHPYVPWVGGGTLVGPYRFLTAAHVVEVFAEGRGESVTMRDDVRAYLAAGPSTGSRISYRLPVKRVLFSHPFFDVALCELGTGEVDNPDEDSELGIPNGVTLAAELPEPLDSREVAVISFAAADPRNEPSAIEQVYGPSVGTGLYLQPGMTWQTMSDVMGRPAVVHDCSTLSGSTGGPLLDLASGEVLGIHYAGRFDGENYAVPAWLLAKDRRVRAHDIRFAGDPDWMGQWAVADLAAREADGVPPEPPAEPEPDPQLHYFSQAELYSIRNLLLEANLAHADRIPLLFVAMNFGFIGTLPTEGAPDARLLSILNILNQTPRLSTGELPMRTLLFNAVENSKLFPQSAQLKTYLDRLPGP